MKTQALKDLIAKVEAGHVASRFDPMLEKALYTGGKSMISIVYPAGQAIVEGDVNAALALKDELASEWGHDLAYNGADGRLFMLTKFHSHIRRYAIHKSLATAILLATLKAKLYELENE